LSPCLSSSIFFSVPSDNNIFVPASKQSTPGFVPPPPPPIIGSASGWDKLIASARACIPDVPLKHLILFTSILCTFKVSK
jgi:hypothetical protein